jgi:hypothetical protein
VQQPAAAASHNGSEWQQTWQQEQQLGAAWRLVSIQTFKAIEDYTSSQICMCHCSRRIQACKRQGSRQACWVKDMQGSQMSPVSGVDAGVVGVHMT